MKDSFPVKGSNGKTWKELNARVLQYISSFQKRRRRVDASSQHVGGILKFQCGWTELSSHAAMWESAVGHRIVIFIHRKTYDKMVFEFTLVRAARNRWHTKICYVVHTSLLPLRVRSPFHCSKTRMHSCTQCPRIRVGDIQHFIGSIHTESPYACWQRAIDYCGGPYCEPEKKPKVILVVEWDKAWCRLCNGTIPHFWGWDCDRTGSKLTYRQQGECLAHRVRNL